MQKSTLAKRIWGIQQAIVLNIAAPLGVYQLSTSSGLSEMQGLLLAASVPLGNLVWTLIRRRRIDPIGGLALVAIVCGAVASLVFNDPRVLLVKDSLATALLGVGCLVSLIVNRPLLELFAANFGADRPTLANPQAQAGLRRITLIWGLAFIAEATVRVALSYVLAPFVLMSVSPLLAAAVFGPLGLWTLQRTRRAQTILATSA